MSDGPGDDLPPRPRTRGECKDGPRPCLWVSCRHHLYLHVETDGTLRLPHSVEPDEMVESCALDVADRDEPPDAAEVGALLGLSTDRVRQIEAQAGERVRRAAPWFRSDLGRQVHRRLPVLSDDEEDDDDP